MTETEVQRLLLNLLEEKSPSVLDQAIADALREHSFLLQFGDAGVETFKQQLAVSILRAAIFPKRANHG